MSHLSACGNWLFVIDEAAPKKPFRWIRIPAVAAIRGCKYCGAEKLCACRNLSGRQATDVHYVRRRRYADEGVENMKSKYTDEQIKAP